VTVRPKGPDAQTLILGTNVKRVNLKIALVIESEEELRRSAVQFLRSYGWIVHGVRKADHAFPVLTQIPYNLIVMGSELIGMTTIEFVRILSNSKEWLRTISLIAIAEASTRTLTAELETFGVFLANKRTWKSDVPRFLSTLDQAFDCDVGERDRVLAD
jgi:CheY-like chemotaxis protein